jgi:hypothetical protein
MEKIESEVRHPRAYSHLGHASPNPKLTGPGFACLVLGVVEDPLLLDITGLTGRVYSDLYRDT